jgi:hypothetical protein
LNPAILMMTTSELLLRDAEIGNALDHFFDQAMEDPRTWEPNRPRRQSLLSQRREVRDQLNARHIRNEN